MVSTPFCLILPQDIFKFSLGPFNFPIKNFSPRFYLVRFSILEFQRGERKMMDKRERDQLILMRKIVKFSIKEFFLTREMSSRWFWVSKLLEKIDLSQERFFSHLILCFLIDFGVFLFDEFLFEVIKVFFRCFQIKLY